MQESNIEYILELLKGELEPIQVKINKNFSVPKQAVALIIGSPRSGTTLILQYLAASGFFSYPTNLLTRFSFSPYIGAQVQELMFNEKFGMDIQQNLFTSNLGKSTGSSGVNEFYHFWRRFISNDYPQYISKTDFNKIRFDKLFQELASIEYVFGKPFICKGIMLQYNISDIKEDIENMFFIRIKRKAEFVMQSIFLARQEHYNNIKIWWSVKPKEYNELRNLDIYHQIAGQVYFTENALSKGLNSIEQEKHVLVSYEDFCNSPHKTRDLIFEKYNIKIATSQNNKNLPKNFVNSDYVKISKKEFDLLVSAFKDFEDKYGLLA